MRHKPVLLQEIVEGLNLKKDSVYIDCNLGDGGHTQAVIEALEGKVGVVGFDLDQVAIDRASKNIAEAIKEKHLAFKPETCLHLFRKNFRTLAKTLEEADMPAKDFADAVLFDLGLSSYEIDESGRGFSFQKDEPLSMTFGKKLDEGEENEHGDTAFDAADIVNGWKEEDIANVIFAYGEDRYARRIAKRIVETRDALLKQSAGAGKEPGANAGIRTTKQLADIVKSAYPSFAKAAGKPGKIHPATRTFQALRIAVNDELRALESALPQAMDVLKPGGRLAVISFHSLEDRIVKNFFKKKAEEGIGKIITKRPLTATDEEAKENPRARSAKLRIIEKI
jgi:16S rRNA (cytosine1402-N4)-methyltransferase